jgi:hypothetical protein
VEEEIKNNPPNSVEHSGDPREKAERGELICGTLQVTTF